MQLETARMWMQGWHAEDWTAFRPIATDPEVMRYISGGQPWPDDQIREFVQRQIGHLATHGFCLWKLTDKHDNAFLGFCGLQPVFIAERNEIEIGWWLTREKWGQGLTTEAAQTALRDGFERAALNRIVAIAQPANRASIRIMEKIGMRYERDAVHKGINVVLYSREIQRLRIPIFVVSIEGVSPTGGILCSFSCLALLLARSMRRSTCRSRLQPC